MKRTWKWLAMLGVGAGLMLPPGVAHADTFVNPTGPADGACLASGNGGIANGCFAPTFAISGTGTAGASSCSSTALAVSVFGSACAAPDGTLTTAGYHVNGLAISGAGSATSDFVAVSGTGSASAPVAVTPLRTVYNVNGLPSEYCEKDTDVGNRFYDGKLYWQCIQPAMGIFIWLPIGA